MATKRVLIKKVYFPHVKEAREALRDKALKILEDYLSVVKAAQDAGDYEVASKSLQWLMEHMPEEEGQKMIEASIDKPKQVEGAKAPVIQIGFAIGGISAPQELPEADVPLGPPRRYIEGEEVK